MIRKSDIVLIISICLFVFILLTLTGCAHKPDFEGDDTRYKYTDCVLANLQDDTIDNLYDFCRQKHEKVHK